MQSNTSITLLKRVRERLAGIKGRIVHDLYLMKTGYSDTGERVNPDFPSENFENHLKVYKFLRQFAAGVDVLDVGCGTGYGTALLAEEARSIVGIDISTAAVSWASKRYPNVKYVEMDVQKLDFADSTFDLIVSSENFEHLRNQRAHVLEAARVLKPGGLCFIATPNPEMFIGHVNPYHTKENTFGELLALFSDSFGNISIVENSLEPPTSIGRELRQQRWLEGHRGVPVPSGVDTTWAHNTHSFFCFLRLPKKV